MNPACCSNNSAVYSLSQHLVCSRLTPLEVQDEGQVADLIARKCTCLGGAGKCRKLRHVVVSGSLRHLAAMDRPLSVHQQDPTGAKALQFARAHRRLVELVRYSLGQQLVLPSLKLITMRVRFLGLL